MRLFVSLREVSPSFLPKILRVKDHNCIIASFKVAEKEVFRSHFSEQLGGRLTSFSDLLDVDCKELAAWSFPCCSPASIVDVLPGLCTIS